MAIEQRPGGFEWTTLESGPEVFRVRIPKTDGRPLPTRWAERISGIPPPRRLKLLRRPRWALPIRSGVKTGYHPSNALG